MATNYIASGDTLTHTPTTAVVSGQLLAVGAVPGVAITDIAAGKTGAVRVIGAWQVPKVPGIAVTQGEAVNFDASEVAFDSATATPAAGDITGNAFAFADASESATSMVVVLTGVPGTVTGA